MKIKIISKEEALNLPNVMLQPDWAINNNIYTIVWFNKQNSNGVFEHMLGNIYDADASGDSIRINNWQRENECQASGWFILSREYYEVINEDTI